MIDGIGGAFLFSNDTKRLAAWYRDCLGIVPQGEDAECSSIYASFEYRDLANPEDQANDSVGDHAHGSGHQGQAANGQD